MCTFEREQWSCKPNELHTLEVYKIWYVEFRIRLLQYSAFAFFFALVCSSHKSSDTCCGADPLVFGVGHFAIFRKINLYGKINCSAHDHQNEKLNDHFFFSLPNHSRSYPEATLHHKTRNAIDSRCAMAKI